MDVKVGLGLGDRTWSVRDSRNECAFKGQEGEGEDRGLNPKKGRGRKRGEKRESLSFAASGNGEDRSEKHKKARRPPLIPPGRCKGQG